MKRSSDCLSAGQLLPPSSSSSFDSYSNNVQSIHESLNSNPNAPNFYTDMNSGNNNDEVDGVKKVKLEEGDGNNNGHDGQSSRQPNGPSRVVHVRNIPNEANENDLINLGLPFGKISNILLLKGKNQAFIEFGDIASAQCMVSYWQLNSMNAQPTVRGRNVFCQFSNHQQLKQQPNGNESQNGVGQYGNGSSYGGNRGGSSDQSCIESTVLRVVVEHLLYPVTLDTFYQLFSRFGKVTKIVTFTKNQSLQALVQYDSIYSASSAKQSLDAQAMFGGSSNILRVDFSKLTNLNVKYNNDKSRDYTNPGLPSSPGGGAGPGGMGGQVGGYGSPAGYGPGSPQGGNPAYGMGGSAGGSRSGHGMARDVQMAAAHHAMMGISPVILVSNLPEEIQSPDALFTLFGVYGDVMRVKVLFNKKDNALIQMAEPHQASLALNYLDKLKLFGKMIRVTSSKHSVVQLPKEGQPDSGLTKDFSGSSNLHRFKKPGSKNYSNIYPPSTTLHLSNIPATISEEEIKQMFLDEMNAALSGNTGGGEEEGDGATGGQGPEHPVEITGFKFFPKDRKMALIGFPSVELAVLALIKMHNYQMAESSHLRVSFSKSSI